MRIVRFAMLVPALFLYGCPTAAAPAPNLPFYEDVYFAQKPRGPGDKGNFSLERHVLPDDLGDEETDSESKKLLESRSGWRYFLAYDDSEAIGKASGGALQNGREMPAEGRGFVRKNDKAIYGTDESVAVTMWALGRITEVFTGTAPAVVGDLSRQGGGRLKPHLSHQNGRDIDLGYYLNDNAASNHFVTVDANSMDLIKTWKLIDLLLSTGRVELMLIDRSLHRALYDSALELGWSEQDLDELFEAPVGNGKRQGVIRHSPGHKHHFHVRFKCPEKDKRCR